MVTALLCTTLLLSAGGEALAGGGEGGSIRRAADKLRLPARCRLARQRVKGNLRRGVIPRNAISKGFAWEELRRRGPVGACSSRLLHTIPYMAISMLDRKSDLPYEQILAPSCRGHH